MFPNRSGRRRPRSIFIVVLLLSTLVLSAVLAYQAQDAVRSHRQTAESALRDYAAFAAWEYAGQAKSTLHERAVGPALLPITAANLESWEEGTAPSLILEKSHYHAEKTARGAVAYYFKLDLGTSELITAGRTPPRHECDWLVEALPGHAQDRYLADWDYATLMVPETESPRTIVYRLEYDPDSTATAAWGFEVDLEKAAAFEKAFALGSFLPPSLTLGLPNDSLLAVTVTDPVGRVLYRSTPQYPGRFVAAQPLPGAFDWMTARVSLRPQVAEELVIGGLPRSRLPLVIGLLLLTAGLVAAALTLLSREYELARLQTEFISSVSHELRTPLAQIRMFAETLLLDRIRSDGEKRRSLEIIDQESLRLSHLVDNVLHFSRSERRVSKIAPEPTELRPVLEGILEAFAPLSETRDVTVREELEPGLVADVDDGALCQVMLNLLDNAVKYGPAGQTIHVVLERSGDCARIAVEDQGPGVPEDERDGIWEPFSRLDRERGSSVAGTGIGLAVVADLIAQHHGRTRVEDAPGGGARFVVELPLVAAEARVAPTSAADGAADVAEDVEAEARATARVGPGAGRGAT